MNYKILLSVLVSTCLTACVNSTKSSPAYNQVDRKEKQNHVTIQKPTIEQDVYIREAIRQIELNKSKSKSTKKKDFIGEYTYRASDTDSKMSSRKKASAALKETLLNEIGVHISSTLKITKQATIDKRIKTEINHVITSYTAGSVSLKVIKEKWDGSDFYLKGKISIDPESVAEGISEGLKAESERKTIAELKVLINKQEQSLDVRSKKLTTLQHGLSRSLLLTKSKESELLKLRLKLSNAEIKLAKYEAEDRRIRSKYDRIMQRVNTNTSKASRLAKPGMRYKDITTLLGKPDSIYSSTASYGSTIIHFNGYKPQDSVVECVIRQKGKWNSCKNIQKYESYRIYAY